MEKRIERLEVGAAIGKGHHRLTCDALIDNVVEPKRRTRRRRGKGG